MTAEERTLGAHFLETALAGFTRYKRLADKAFEQLEADDFYKHVGDNTNSVYVIARHVSGNLLSRWTDFLTTDGEKPDRHRDSEFVEERKSRQEILAIWEAGWARLFKTLSELTETDLLETVYIRAEPYTVMGAIVRADEHIAYHVGQILMLARHAKGRDWKWLTIAPGESAKFVRKPPK
jgi:hypothetical protein